MSGHYGEDDLILYHYGESRQPAEVARHLESCATCADAYRDLAGTLQLIAAPAVPERGEQYGVEVWHRIRHELPERDPGWLDLFSWNQFVMAGTAAGLLLAVAAAFTAGRASRPGGPAVTTGSIVAADDANTRARLAAIGDHLERSERVLLDVVNASGRAVDLRAAQLWAGELVDANRLYRAAAARAGDMVVADVLDDLEHRLLEIVHGPAKPTLAQLTELHLRLDAATLLFKVRILQDELRQREQAPAVSQNTTGTRS
jgi:hypothetical protein